MADSNNSQDSDNSEEISEEILEPQDATKIKEIQKKFMETVNEMISHRIKFPKEFKLFYRVMFHSDRQGKVASVKPFLTETDAILDCKENVYDDNGRYWSQKIYKVVDSTNSVSLEYYDTNNKTEHEVDIHLNEIAY